MNPAQLAKLEQALAHNRDAQAETIAAVRQRLADGTPREFVFYELVAMFLEDPDKATTAAAIAVLTLAEQDTAREEATAP